MPDEQTPDPRCESCFYWRWLFQVGTVATRNNLKCCHYCLDNRRTRSKVENGCASYLHKSKRKISRIFNPDLRELREGLKQERQPLRIISPRRGWKYY